MGHVGMGEMSHSDRSGIEENVQGRGSKNLVIQVDTIVKIEPRSSGQGNQTKNGKDSANCFTNASLFSAAGDSAKLASTTYAYSSGELTALRSSPLFRLSAGSFSTPAVLKLVCEAKLQAKELANSKWIWIKWFNTSNNVCVATNIGTLSIHSIAATLTQDYSIPFLP
jgi:hypothetical protein